jgi:glycerophosphoryl diester phosphodiesterase
LEGARRCLKAPVDGIEIDVQITADGHVVAHHDYRISRDHARLNGAWLTEAGAPIKTLTLAELDRYDVGRLRPGSPYADRYPDREDMDGVRIPTLRALLEALKATPGERPMLYVEIKTDPQNPADAPEPSVILDAVFADLRAEDYLEHAKIIAFDWQVLRLAVDRWPQIRTAHLTIPPALSAASAKAGPSPWRDGFDAEDYGGSDLAAVKAHGGMEWSPYFTDVTPETMAEARALDLLVGPWGLSKGADIRRMVELGVYSSTVSGADWGD